MTNMLQSISDRLLNIAKARDEDFQFVLVRYGSERHPGSVAKARLGCPGPRQGDPQHLHGPQASCSQVDSCRIVRSFHPGRGEAATVGCVRAAKQPFHPGRGLDLRGRTDLSISGTSLRESARRFVLVMIVPGAVLADKPAWSYATVFQLRRIRHN